MIPLRIFLPLRDEFRLDRPFDKAFRNRDIFRLDAVHDAKESVLKGIDRPQLRVLYEHISLTQGRKKAVSIETYPIYRARTLDVEGGRIQFEDSVEISRSIHL